MKTNTKPIAVPLSVAWNNVILQVLRPADRNGIILPDEAWETDLIQHGLILAAGPRVREQNPGFIVGAHVLFTAPGSMPFMLGGEKLVRAFDSSIIAVVTEVT